MQSLPLFLDTAGRRIGLIGGTAAAEAKLRLLEKTEAEIVWLDPFAPAEEMVGLAALFVSTGDEALDTKIATRAALAHVPVNVVDRPHLSTFTVPAIVDRSPVTVAIGTEGTAPGLARALRQEIEAALPARTGLLARVAGAFRDSLKGILPNVNDRRVFWDGVFAPDGRADLSNLDEAELRRELLRRANSATGERVGRVILVGAGPGDPELLTLKALNALSVADVIIHDRLIPDAILDRARRDAERLYVGKERSLHSVPQNEIHDLLIERARAGETVVRLKGGDPFVFGRGGEEVEAIEAAGIRVDVIPGITAALGCAASARVPLTHRGVADAVTFVTGELKPGTTQSFKGLAGEGRTIVLYMGLHAAPRAAEEMIADGFRPETPVMIVERGTQPDERKIPATLISLAETIAIFGVESPALIIVGDVAALGLGAAVLENQTKEQVA